MALVALGLALAYQFGTEQTWYLELLRYTPFLLYVVPACLALAVSLLLGWGWRLLALATLALMLTQVMGLSLGLDRADAPPRAENRTLRFMTYNIKSYRAVWRRTGFEAIAEEIGQHAPDVIVMQDANELVKRGLPPEMLQVLPDYKTYAFGQYVVASRYPLSGCAPGDISYGEAKHTYVHCVVTVNGLAIDLYTAHLITPREGLNAARHDKLEGLDDWRENFAARLTQSHKLQEALVNRVPQRPVIVAGDLNAAEHSPVVGNLRALGLRDAYSAAGRGYGYTVGHALKPGISILRIDHILVSADLGVSFCDTGWRGASEHRPVIADLVLPPADAAPAPGKGKARPGKS